MVLVVLGLVAAESIGQDKGAPDTWERILSNDCIWLGELGDSLVTVGFVKKPAGGRVISISAHEQRGRTKATDYFVGTYSVPKVDKKFVTLECKLTVFRAYENDKLVVEKKISKTIKLKIYREAANPLDRLRMYQWCAESKGWSLGWWKGSWNETEENVRDSHSLEFSRVRR